MSKVRLGIEIECIIDKEKFNFNRDSYHHGVEGRDIDGWAIESDSSINITGCSSFGNPVESELVSTVAVGTDEMLELIDNIKEAMNEPDMNKVMRFNSSCGAHIHFSSLFKKEGKLNFMHYFKKLRENTFERVKAEYPEIYPKFRKQYFRGYAKEQKDETIDKNKRELEFNFTSLKKGVEWRSFNLAGVKTWEELKGMVRIACEEIEKILTEMKQQNYKEVLKRKITPTELRKYEEELNVILNDVEID